MTRASLLELICTGFSRLNDFQKGYFLGVGDGLTMASVKSREPSPATERTAARPGA